MNITKTQSKLIVGANLDVLPSKGLKDVLAFYSGIKRAGAITIKLSKRTLSANFYVLSRSADNQKCAPVVKTDLKLSELILNDPNRIKDHQRKSECCINNFRRLEDVPAFYTDIK